MSEARLSTEASVAAENPSATPAPRLSFPFLPGEPETASVSIGDTTHGRVVNARTLDESDSLKILPKQKERDLRYGTSELVLLLEQAAGKLYQQTKTPLWVGNLGRREGGDIEWSVSHNAGRDADVAFCYQDPVTKRPVDPPDLLPLGKDGFSKDKRVAFDAARTWLVVRSMLEFEGASLQHLFVSENLKRKLLEHARAIGEPARLIERAGDILRQPAHAAPHDDHLHVRIYCSPFDAGGGCRDIGYVHPFAKTYESEREKSAGRARERVTASDPVIRRAALLRLGLIGNANDVELGLTRLQDSEADVRVAACELVGALGDEKDTPSLVQRFREETDPAGAFALLQAIGTLGGPDAGPFLSDLLTAFAEAPLTTSAEPVCVDDVATDSPPELLRQSCTARPSFIPGDPPSSWFNPQSSRELGLLLAPRAMPDAVLDRRGILKLAVQAARYADRLEPVAALVSLLDIRDPELAQLSALSLAFITNQRLFDEGPSRPLSTRLAEARREYAALLSGLGPKAPRDAWVVRGFAKRGYRVTTLGRQSAWELLRATADEPYLAYNGRRALAKLLGQSPEVLHYGAGDACRWLHSLLWQRKRELGLERPTEAQLASCSKARRREQVTVSTKEN